MEKCYITWFSCPLGCHEMMNLDSQRVPHKMSKKNSFGVSSCVPKRASI